MIAPTLLVGLGGAGSKVVTRVSKLVSEEQRDHLGFAVFDTDINELRDIQRANPFIKIIQTSTKLSVGEYLNIDTHARDTWFPVNAILNSKTLTEGAGQVRAISRLAFDTAIRAGKMEQLHEAIQDLYKLEEGQAEQALRVIIVSSLAGGTGSGLILPVALYLKNYLATHFRQSANITRGFFILPEVFDLVIPGQAERNSLRSNAYATLRELDAFLMRGDATLPEHYLDSVRIDFPRVSSEGYEEYNVRPYDFCFLFDAQNAEGSKLNSFNQYLDHAANCIYAQSIGPMNKRSNSSEDNTIRRLAAERGRNRYAGAGSSMLIYPVEDVKEYIALNWAKENVSSQWLVFDNVFKALKKRNNEMRAQGLSVIDSDPASSYVNTVESMAKDKDPFARAIVNACATFDADGLSKVSDKWDEYLDALKKKITMDESSGQANLDAQKQQVMISIGEIEGGKDSWEAFQQAYREMEKYRAMIVKRTEDTARTIAYTMFNAPAENVTSDGLSHRLETYLRDGENKFIHPNAVRYFLYKTREGLLEEKRLVEKEISDEEKFFENFAEAHFENEKDEDAEATVENLSDRKTKLLSRLTGKLSGEQQDLKTAYSNYMVQANKFRVNAVLAKVYDEGITYVSNLSDAYQSFFSTFESRVADIEKRIVEISKRYANSKGTTARYVCANKLCLNYMVDKHPYMGNSITIDSALAEDIYNQVRKYSLLLTKPANSGYFNELFENGILGFYKTSVMRTYSSSVDMDIITALETEAMIELEEEVKAAAARNRVFEYDNATINAYVEKAIRNSRALSCPFIEKPLGMEKQPIYACAYNPCLITGDESPRSQLIERELANAGGVADDDIGKNMILFYQSLYGLRANELSKFAPPEKSLTSTRDGGEYYKAYFELISNVHPEAHRSKAITPHIDRWWHVVTKMPDLDEGNQAEQEQQIFAAFFWGLLGNYVDLYDVGADQRHYRLNVDELNMDESAGTLVVSNGTPCDRLYEVLDAFSIYPELVQKVLARVETLTNDDVDRAVPVEEGILMVNLKTFRIREFPLGEDNRVRSIFDIPGLMAKSTRSDDFNEESVLNILRAELSEIRKYLLRFCTKKELPDVMGPLMTQQFGLFMDAMKLEAARNPKVFSDYLFTRTCSLIAKAYEDLGLIREAKELHATARELGK